MFYEDIYVGNRDTVSSLGLAYGYKHHHWNGIWDNRKNAELVARRGKPENVRAGDRLYIPIPWTIVSKNFSNKGDGAQIVAERDGELGKKLTWVQTVYRHNQPIGPNPNPYCVDACTPDDNLPFYFTDTEIAADPKRRKRFSDHSSRSPPTVAQGTTKWRAIVSLALVNEKRVTVWNSLVWGWDMTPGGAVATVGPRTATRSEIVGHLYLMRTGVGTGAKTFEKTGWTFRAARAEA